MGRSVLDKARHGGHVTQKDVGEGEAARLHEGGGEGGLAQAPHLVTPNVEAGASVNLHHLLTCKASGSVPSRKKGSNNYNICNIYIIYTAKKILYR